MPVIGAAFDYVENGGVFVALRTFPQPSHAALVVASASGAVKLVLSYVFQGLVVVGLLLRAVTALSGRATRAA